MLWTSRQIATFTRTYGADSVYAETLWRPMAQRLCPDVLEAFDRYWNRGDDPLGPNWHGLAGDVERAMVRAHADEDRAGLDDLYTFVNWAFLEPTSFMPNETMTSIGQSLASDIAPALWVERFPPEIVDEIIAYAQGYFRPHVAASIRLARADRLSHSDLRCESWQDLHHRFIALTDELGLPRASPLLEPGT